MDVGSFLGQLRRLESWRSSTMQRHDGKHQSRSIASAKFQRYGHRVRSRQNHWPERVRNCDADAMALGENPRSQVHFNIEWIHPAGFEIARLAHRFALRAIQSCTGNLRDG